MKNIFIFLLFIPFVTTAQSDQPNQSVQEKAFSNIAICRTEFIDPTGHHFTTYTSGIILKGSYFLTCYHDAVFPQCTVKNRIVACNYEYVNGKLLYEAVPVLNYFKPNKNQYDFSKHRYDSSDHTTDIYMFKLSKKISAKKYEFDSSYTDQGDTLYAWGAFENKKEHITTPRFATSNIIFNLKESRNSSTFFLVSLGNLGVGFSGSPIYTSNGRISGITLFGWDIGVPYKALDELQNKKIISKELYNTIVDGYTKGLSLTGALPINYIINKYLNGYL